ncbi:DnaD domain protein [Aeribacillus composti]|uniref:DNA replication protein n=1 Tax=Anoxybacillus phage A403 TaxID=2099336 RepID=A0A2P1JTY8_9CAUD|nr:DnaD-like helicase loader [Anoxybacillus phage A403]AVO22608.1 DNA replication protein [Anoxybacillus phage A403]
MQGWIKLHRKIQEHWLYQDKRKFSRFEAWVDLLLMVNHDDSKVVLGNEIIEVKRGQRITSIRQLCEKWGWSNTKVTQFLKLLQNDGMIEVKSDTKKTIITVVNYDFYQGREDAKTTENRHKNDDGQTQKHTNKNDKNVKNDKEILKKEEEENPITLYEKNFYPLTPIQMESLWKWVDDFNGNKEVICQAIKETALKNPKVPFRYLERILNDWYRRELFTVDDVMEEKRRYEQSKIIQYPSNKKRSLFDQGEESRRRQAEAEARAEMIDDNELRKMIEEMPY